MAGSPTMRQEVMVVAALWDTNPEAAASAFGDLLGKLRFREHGDAISRYLKSLVPPELVRAAHERGLANQLNL